MYIVGKHFSYCVQQNLNDSSMMIGSKVKLTTGHSLILTTDHYDMGIKMKNI
jgi:hypothetical protein